MDNTRTDKILVLGGRKLRCIEAIPLGMVFDLAEAMEDGSSGMKAIAAMSKMVRNIVVKEDRGALKEMLADTEKPVTFDELNTGLGDLLKAYNVGRPLGRPSASSPGPDKTGGTSKVVSLSRATDRERAASSTDGRSAAS